MQYPIIGITSSGMFSGKTTAAEFLREFTLDRGELPRIAKIAQPLYDVVAFLEDRIGLKMRKATSRPIMQFIGNHMRREYGGHFWIDLFDYDNSELYGKELLIVDDVRYDEEAEQIKKMGGFILHISSPEELRGRRGTLVNANDISERGISANFIDHTIHNVSTKEAFKLAIRGVFNERL